MASSSSPPPSGVSDMTEEQKQEQLAVAASVKEQECIHKTKIIQFLGRTTPIIMQNNNGPCPLLAICNVLLLRNNLNLSPDTTEVSQEKLLSLVAERIIDSNSNVDNKVAGYVENQQQNIADAIDLLPRLATGIDVNIQFRRIDDFEFTRECAIFDLLDIPLYHGWLVDFQDTNTTNAIGSKSYNTITSELVALETGNMESESKNNPEEDCVDFAAATTATLGVPSPCLSKARSFDDFPPIESDHQNLRKGDIEEEAELLKALKLSETEFPYSASNSLITNIDGGAMSVSSDETTCTKNIMSVDSIDSLVCHVIVENQKSDLPEPLLVDDCNASRNDNNDLKSLNTIPLVEATLSSKTDDENHLDQSTCVKSGKLLICSDAVEKSSVDKYVPEETAASLSPGDYSPSVDKNLINIPEGSDKVNKFTTATDHHDPADNQSVGDSTELSCLSAPNADSDLCNGRVQPADVPEPLAPSLDGSEPIYEGEECIMDTGTTVLEEREPVYEGEMVLAGQAQQGELIRNFLKNSASQLTIYGLFCLQEGLKERELCVFFRNNHFSTMFKYDGELYLLATDQGYINEPDVVWEKLNEVKGDTQYMTSNFKVFDPQSHVNKTWDENNVMTSTADYLATIDSASQAGLDMNSDLQLAIALQQQEFEQQPQAQRHNPQPQSTSGSSRLVTGPQVRRESRTSTSSPRADAKKDKCTIM